MDLIVEASRDDNIVTILWVVTQVMSILCEHDGFSLSYFGSGGLASILAVRDGFLILLESVGVIKQPSRYLVLRCTSPEVSTSTKVSSEASTEKLIQVKALQTWYPFHQAI